MKVNCVASQFRGRLADGHARRRCGRRLCAGRVVISSRRISFKISNLAPKIFKRSTTFWEEMKTTEWMEALEYIHWVAPYLDTRGRPKQLITCRTLPPPFIWRVWIDASPPGGTCVKFEWFIGRVLSERGIQWFVTLVSLSFYRYDYYCCDISLRPYANEGPGYWPLFGILSLGSAWVTVGLLFIYFLQYLVAWLLFFF